MHLKDTIKLINNNLEKIGYSHLDGKSVFISQDRQPFFNFSPFLTAKSHFVNRSKDRFYINQECFRYMPMDMIMNSPLAVPFQHAVGIYHTEYIEVRKILNNFKSMFDNLLPSVPIYAIVNEENIDVLSLTRSIFNKTIPFVREDMKMRNMPLSDDAEYIRLVAHYKNGIVALVNLVMIDRIELDAKIDGLIFTERFHFIINEKEHIYETDVYKNSCKIADATFKDIKLKYIILSNLRSALKLIHAGCSVGGKKAGHNLKKLLKESSLTFFALEEKVKKEVLMSFIENAQLDVDESNDSYNVEIYELMYKYLNENYKMFDKFSEEIKITKNRNELFEYWSNTFGMTETIYNLMRTGTKKSELEVGKNGALQNGFFGYLFKNNDIFDPIKFYGDKSKQVKEQRELGS